MLNAATDCYHSAMPLELLLTVLVAGMLASLACGLGALPLLIRRLDPRRTPR